MKRKEVYATTGTRMLVRFFGGWDFERNDALIHHGVTGVTGDLHVRFLRPVPLEGSMDLRAWICSSSPRLFTLRAELTPRGQTAAWAEATFARHRVSPH